MIIFACILCLVCVFFLSFAVKERESVFVIPSLLLGGIASLIFFLNISYYTYDIVKNPQYYKFSDRVVYLYKGELLESRDIEFYKNIGEKDYVLEVKISKNIFRQAIKSEFSIKKEGE